MKNNLFKMQIAYTIFFILTAILYFVNYEYITKIDSFSEGYYLLPALFFLICILLVSINDMAKNREEEKKIFFKYFFILVELLLLSVLSCMINNQIDKIEFSKHCKKTSAKIYYINVHEYTSREYDQINDIDKTVTKYIFEYHFNYIANGIDYKDLYSVTYSHDDPIYHNISSFKLYYNTNNPTFWRKSISYVSIDYSIALGAVLIVIRAICLRKYINEYQETNKDKALKN